jgi:hypothetical protein
MIDADQFEQQAMVYAGGQGGEYLESINKLSWKAMTQAEWDTFINVVITNYVTRNTELIIQEASDGELDWIRRGEPVKASKYERNFFRTGEHLKARGEPKPARGEPKPGRGELPADTP